MRVLIVNTSERTGGAAIAAHRLMDALNNNGVKAKMLVQKKETEDISVVGLNKPWLQRWRFLWERWCIFVRLWFSRKNLFNIDIANAGADITRLREFREADIIHLHWINQGFLSLKSIQRILESGKPVVWTMHDAWAATGICHFTMECQHFKTYCHHCPYLPNGGGKNDLSSQIWKQKKLLYNRYNVYFVTCSQWLAKEAKQSTLLTGQKITNIPNAIDTHIFCKRDKNSAREELQLPLDKKLILFASHKVTDERKGMGYLINAVQQLEKTYTEVREQLALAVLGGQSDEIQAQIGLPVFPLGYTTDVKTLVNAYNAADLFILPSLSDNLPNTIMEAMACGVPCVGFEVGGIPEMIEHKKNGYVAAYKNAEDLAKGIFWTLYESDSEMLSDNAVKKVTKDYSQQSVAAKYTEVYQQAMTFKHYQL